MSVPDRIVVYVGTTIDPLSPRGIEALIDVIGAYPSVAPTHYGTDERRQRALNEDGLRDLVAGFGRSDFTLNMKREAPPTMSGYINAMGARHLPAGLCHGKITWEGLREADRIPVFGFGAALAAALEAAYGMVHPVWDFGERSQRYSEAGLVVFHELQRFGPPGVAALTWFGPHMAELFGRERLLNAGAAAHATPWGGIELRLCDDPATASFEVLEIAQRTVMAALAPAGVFGNYSTIEPEAGANWTPIPSEADR